MRRIQGFAAAWLLGCATIGWAQEHAAHNAAARDSKPWPAKPAVAVGAPLNDDGRLTSHRFDSLAIDGAGRVAVMWLDARDRDAVKEKGGLFAGISVYVAQSKDNGASFAANRPLTEHTCECCRTAWSGRRKAPWRSGAIYMASTPAILRWPTWTVVILNP